MNNESTITERGQITLPIEIRQRYALKPGTKIKFTVTPQGIIITKAVSARAAIESVSGILNKNKKNKYNNMSTDAYIEAIRGKVE